MVSRKQNVYYNPPEEVQEIGRSLAWGPMTGSFEALSEQLEEDEVIVDLCDHFVWKSASVITSQDDIDEMLPQIRGGTVRREGFYAISKEQVESGTGQKLE